MTETAPATDDVPSTAPATESRREAELATYDVPPTEPAAWTSTIAVPAAVDVPAIPPESSTTAALSASKRLIAGRRNRR